MNLLRKVAMLVLVVSGLMIQSCSEDECKDVDCGPNGTCFEGLCLCDLGIGGTDCTKILREEFLGSYSVEEDCAGVAFDYNTVMQAGSGTEDLDLVRIRNFGNFNCIDGNGNQVDYEVEARIRDNRVIEIVSTEACATVFEGLGNMNIINGDTTITITYSATFDPGTGLVTENCTAILLKQ